MEFEVLPLFQGVKNTPKHWTVSELTSKMKSVLEPAFSEVWLIGEVSNYRPSASGHLYFSLKDSNAMISVALFGWGNRKRNFQLKDGLQVLCRGKVSIYAPRGSYQMVVDHLEPLGAGALQVAFEQLKEKLQSEGLFDSGKKKQIPTFPKKIAVITSPTGAAIRDMLNILKRRAPHIEVLVIPAVVQGEDAPTQLIRGLEVANRFNLGEVIILARGGGSIEDMWCFNDEMLARTIARSKIPVISAVGHEIDFTISDFVSDLRAPTPSAAAEIVSGHWVDVNRQVLQSFDRIRNHISRDLKNRRSVLAHVSARLVSPVDRIRERMQRCDDLFTRMERSVISEIQKRRLSLGQWLGKLDALSPLRVLERGYSIVKKSDGSVLRSFKEVKKKDEIQIRLLEGEIRAEII